MLSFALSNLSILPERIEANHKLPKNKLVILKLRLWKCLFFLLKCLFHLLQLLLLGSRTGFFVIKLPKLGFPFFGLFLKVLLDLSETFSLDDVGIEDFLTYIGLQFHRDSEERSQTRVFEKMQFLVFLHFADIDLSFGPILTFSFFLIFTFLNFFLQQSAKHTLLTESFTNHESMVGVRCCFELDYFRSFSLKVGFLRIFPIKVNVFERLFKLSNVYSCEAFLLLDPFAKLR